MDVSNLYTFVLTLVLVGMVLGVGIMVLGKFQTVIIVEAANCGLNASGGTGGTIGYSACGEVYDGVGSTVSAIAEIPSTWLGLIVTITVLAIILTLVIRSFVNSGAGNR